MSLPHSKHRIIGLTAAVVAVVVSAPASAGTATAARRTWVAAWAAPMTGGTGAGPTNATVRNITRVTLSGTALRIRLTNPSDSKLVVGAAYVARAAQGASVVSGSAKRITFRGKPQVTVPPRTDALYSDPVAYSVIAQRDLAVSLYLPAGSNPDASTATMNSSYRSANGAGNRAAQSSGTALGTASSSTYALTAVDVLTTQATGAVVGFGSSTFHGTGSTANGYNRVLDLLGSRASKEVPGGLQLSSIAAGIGGDSLHVGLARFTRDVLRQTGVKAVIVYNVNDLISRTAVQIAEDYRVLIRRAHAAGVQVYCPTWPPAAQSVPATVRNNERRKINNWLLQSRACDDVVDWDAVLRGSIVQDEYDPEYLFDGIHPNPAGHRALADSTPISWFRSR
jgi:lysophospholipase L1-like esterase